MSFYISLKKQSVEHLWDATFTSCSQAVSYKTVNRWPAVPHNFSENFVSELMRHFETWQHYHSGAPLVDTELVCPEHTICRWYSWENQHSTTVHSFKMCSFELLYNLWHAAVVSTLSWSWKNKLLRLVVRVLSLSSLMKQPSCVERMGCMMVWNEFGIKGGPNTQEGISIFVLHVIKETPGICVSVSTRQVCSQFALLLCPWKRVGKDDDFSGFDGFTWNGNKFLADSWKLHSSADSPISPVWLHLSRVWEKRKAIDYPQRSSPDLCS